MTSETYFERSENLWAEVLTIRDDIRHAQRLALGGGVSSWPQIEDLLARLETVMDRIQALEREQAMGSGGGSG